MTNELKASIERYMVNYVNFCNEMVEKTRKGEEINDRAVSVLNDSTRVIASHISKQINAGD